MTEPEHYHSMVKMHLSFLLDLHTDECDCSFLYEKQVGGCTYLADERGGPGGIFCPNPKVVIQLDFPEVAS